MWPSRGTSPSASSSEPVHSTAAFTVTRTGTAPTPKEASSSRCFGARGIPADRTACPARTSCPARRILASDATGSGKRTCKPPGASQAPCRRTCSIGATLAAPSGRRAPVMIWQAPPSIAQWPSPANCRRDTGIGVSGGRARCAALSAKPSIAALSKPGRLSGAITSSANTRPTACAAATVSTGDIGARARTAARASAKEITRFSMADGCSVR